MNLGEIIIRYIRCHWKSLFVWCVGVALAIFLIVSGAKIMSGEVENPFDYNTVTGLLLMLIAIRLLTYFSIISETIKEKEVKN